jgi:hypothetical protein
MAAGFRTLSLEVLRHGARSDIKQLCPVLAVRARLLVPAFASVAQAYCSAGSDAAPRTLSVLQSMCYGRYYR